MGSKVNNNEDRQSCKKVITCSESLIRQNKTKIQKIQQQQQGLSLDEMIPSISSHRCEASPRITSPSSIRNTLVNHGKGLQVSPRRQKALELTSLVSTFQETKETSSVRLQQQDELKSFSTENLEAVNDFGEENTSPEGTHNGAKEGHSTDEHGETFAPMVIDSGDDLTMEGCAANDEHCVATNSTLSSTAPSIKAFCPGRMPKRSSLKGSERSKAQSPLPERRSETYEILLPGQSKTIERQRSITFEDKVDVQNIEPVRLLATGGSRSLWYQENEYETIKFKTLALLDRVDHSSGIVDGKKYCTRGLEKFMTPEATEVKKHQAWDSVLNEQFLQRKDGEFDEETLAMIYMYSTKRSRLEASRRANLDAQASEAYLKTTFRRHSSHHEGRDDQTNFNRRVSM